MEPKSDLEELAWTVTGIGLIGALMFVGLISVFFYEVCHRPGGICN